MSDSKSREQTEPEIDSQRPWRSTLSMQRYTVPVEKIFEQLFGKEAEVDERTRELVPTEQLRKPFGRG